MSVQSQDKRREQLAEKLNQLVEKKMKEVEEKRGIVRQPFGRVRQWFHKSPLLEIYYDWCTVLGFTSGVKERIISELEAEEKERWETGKKEKPESEEEKRELEEKKRKFRKKKRQYVTAKAYLNLAEYERNPGRAWNYVNSADKLLPLIVDDDGFDRCLLRLNQWNRSLLDRQENAKETLDELDERYPVAETHHPSQDRIPQVERDNAYCRQAGRAQLWYSVNARLSLRFSLWRSNNVRLGMVLLPAVFLAEVMYHALNPAEPLWYLPFLISSAMGFLGGGLSAFLLAREFIEYMVSPELIKVVTTSRMLLGAAGALVVYTIVGSGFVAGFGIAQLLHENVYVLLGTGITAGFSEQLFVESLDKSAQNLAIIGARKKRW